MTLQDMHCFVGDLGLILDKTVKLEWHRTNNTRTRCLRITQKVGCLQPGFASTAVTYQAAQLKFALHATSMHNRPRLTDTGLLAMGA